MHDNHKSVELGLVFEPYKQVYIINLRYFDGEDLHTVKMMVALHHVRQSPQTLRYIFEDMVNRLKSEHLDDEDFIDTCVNELKKQYVVLCE